MFIVGVQILTYMVKLISGGGNVTADDFYSLAGLSKFVFDYF